MRILVVDDELEIRRVLRLLLENAGYEVSEASCGAEALDILREDGAFDLCIMDVMMPGMSGIDTTAALRRFSAVPVLFLTARSMEKDKAEAYASGGDDYLVKPFSSAELLMKAEAHIRRYNSYGAKESELSCGIRLHGGVILSPTLREVTKNGQIIEMRDKEFDVLMYLAENRGRVVGAEELYSAVWGEMPLPSSSNNVTVHILNLRRKLEDDSQSPRLIRTVWGKGYQID